MIIRLQPQASHHGAPMPAWPAVEAIQRARSESYVLVTQPDHAQISGAIASKFSRELEPHLTPAIARAIAVHDDGWAQFEGHAPDCRPPLTDRSGRPLSFLDAPPETFLQAWSGSIAASTSTSPAGNYIVSRHFQILAERRLRSVEDPPENSQRIRDFAALEAERQVDLLPRAGLSRSQLEHLLKLLQFCDVLSLVICSGANGTLEFPDDFGIGPLRLTVAGNAYELSRASNPRQAIGDAVHQTLTAPVEFSLRSFKFGDGRLTPLSPLSLTIH